MKKMICIVVIMALVIAGGIAETIKSATLFRTLNERLTDLNTDIIEREGELDNPGTLAKIDGIMRLWESNRGFVELFSHHSLARSLDEKLVSLRSWLECNGYEDSRQLCAAAITLTRDLIDETFPVAGNLF